MYADADFVSTVFKSHINFGRCRELEELHVTMRPVDLFGYIDIMWDHIISTLDDPSHLQALKTVTFAFPEHYCTEPCQGMLPLLEHHAARLCSSLLRIPGLQKVEFRSSGEVLGYCPAKRAYLHTAFASLHARNMLVMT